MYSLSSKQFGLQYQNNHPGQILSISWDEGDEIYAPRFHFFDTVDDVANHLKMMYGDQFILAVNGSDRYTKDNAIVAFEDTDMKIEITSWKYDMTVYQFYDGSKYQELKQKLTQES